MGDKEKRFIEKNRINPSDIKYMTRDERKTVIHMEDGKLIDTFHTIKGLMEELPDTMFDCVNKGVVVGLKYVDSVQSNVYKMKDGATFKGRVRVNKSQGDSLNQYLELVKASSNIWREYAILDNLPMAFCIIELVFDDSGHGIDFIFRYCNKEMERLEGKPMDEMLNKSFYEVFENGDKKWLVAYADVALNGVNRVIESYSPEIDSDLKIYCYQPKPNYCACMLMKS